MCSFVLCKRARDNSADQWLVPSMQGIHKLWPVNQSSLASYQAPPTMAAGPQLRKDSACVKNKNIDIGLRQTALNNPIGAMYRLARDCGRVSGVFVCDREAIGYERSRTLA